MNKDFIIYNQNCKEIPNILKENSIDCVITDPPYELTGLKNSKQGFLGKKWDGSGIAFDEEMWGGVLKVMKPGAYLLAFGGTRTFHRMAVAIENAGFEIRDTIMWLYGTGFPKSTNVALSIDKHLGKIKQRGSGFAHASKFTPKGDLLRSDDNLAPYIPRSEEAREWSGYQSCLKPAYEPIIVARKPLIGTMAENILKYRTGALNIKECRVPEKIVKIGERIQRSDKFTGGNFFATEDKGQVININVGQYKGRYPANIIIDNSQDVYNAFPLQDGKSASRFFYSAKCSVLDRNEGLESFRNIHPTVKPTELMQYLVRLVAPPSATILDPFNGSGSTGKAVALENVRANKDYKYIGFELEKEYVDIANARIDHALKLNPTQKNDSFEEISLFKEEEK